MRENMSESKSFNFRPNNTTTTYIFSLFTGVDFFRTSITTVIYLTKKQQEQRRSHTSNVSTVFPISENSGQSSKLNRSLDSDRRKSKEPEDTLEEKMV